MKYYFRDCPSRDVILKGHEIVKSGTFDEVMAYAKENEGKCLPYSLTRATSWRHIIIGIYSRGAMAYTVKQVERRLAETPIFAFLEITILMKDRRLPRWWIERALELAYGGKYEFRIYEICGKRIANTTAWEWLNSDKRYLQIAGVCVCAAKPGLAPKFYIKCVDVDVNLYSLSDIWVKNKIVEATRHLQNSAPSELDLADEA